MNAVTGNTQEELAAELRMLSHGLRTVATSTPYSPA